MFFYRGEQIYAVRKGPFKAHFITQGAYRNREIKKHDPPVLYNLLHDPSEKYDIGKKHPEVIAELRKAYDKWWEETVPLMVNEDAPYAREQPQAVRYENQKAERGIPDWNVPAL